MRKLVFALSLLTVTGAMIVACKKEGGTGPVTNPLKFTYGDSVFYVQGQSYSITPIYHGDGTYEAFPNNLLIDSLTGQITIAVMGRGGESQTGLKYKIIYRSNNSSFIDSTFITISGINYLDRIFNVQAGDSILRPVYNADLSKPIPAGEFGIGADPRLAINPLNGEINLNECKRRGLFDIPAEHGEWEELEVFYRLEDASQKSLNRIDIALYYYNSVPTIPYNVADLMRTHQAMTLGVVQPEIPQTSGTYDKDLPENVSFFKPRPPCVIIVGN
jgi:hypothetical protein